MFKKIFDEGKIGKLVIKNRFVMPAMMLNHGDFDGKPTKAMIEYYKKRAQGGVGLIISEITRVYDKNGAGAFGQLGISHDYHIEPLRKMIDEIHKEDCKFFVQLHHPGIQNEPLCVGLLTPSIYIQKLFKCYKKLFYKLTPTAKKMADKGFVFSVVGPSKVERCSFTNARNRALSKREITKIENAFAKGAERAKKAGADGIELHGAHGYLIEQFLSPRTNKRTDEYGGSLENRCRFLVNIIRKIRDKVGPDFPISVRLSVDEFYDKIGRPEVGYSLNEGLEIVKIIQEEKIDALNISSATYETMNYWLEPTSFEVGWRKYLAKEVKKITKLPVIAANVIRDPYQAEKQLEEGCQDFIAIGRPLLCDPDFVNKTKNNESKLIKRCIGCIYCFESMLNNAYKGFQGECAVNPLMGKETKYKTFKKIENNKKAYIIGAGPGGLTAAEVLLKRGFDVEVYEKEKKIGGQALLASQPPHKEKLNWINEDLLSNIEKLGGKVYLNHEVTEEEILSWQDENNPIIFATGGLAVKPRKIKGIDSKKVLLVTDILRSKAKLTEEKNPENSTICLIGSGMTGLETTLELLERNNKVIIIEMQDQIAKGTYKPQIDNIVPNLLKNGVQFKLSCKLNEINDDGIIVENLENNILENINCDFVILSMGVRPNNTLFDKVKEKRKNIYVIGDAKKPRRIAHATFEGFDLAYNLE